MKPQRGQDQTQVVSGAAQHCMDGITELTLERVAV
jgi:hypothetical protein